MGKLICEVCGSNRIVKEDGLFVCQECGCKYSLEEVRNLISSDAGAPQDSHSRTAHDTAPQNTSDSTIDALLNTASDIIVLYLNGVDANGAKTFFDYDNYNTAKKLIDQAELLAPSNWSVWFYKGLLSYINPNEHTKNAFYEFDRAMKWADEETQRTRILPMIENLSHKVIKSFKVYDVENDPRDWLNRRLGWFVVFYNKYEIAKPYLQRLTEEGNKLIDKYEEYLLDKDKLFAEAGRCVVENERASIAMLQHKLCIGFKRTAKIMDQLEASGVVGPEEGTKPRTVLMTVEQFEKYLECNFHK